MNKKTSILIIIAVVGVLAIAIAYSNLPDMDNETSLTVYSEGPMELNNFIGIIKNSSYYDGYDNQTLKWMESLGDKKVFSSNDSYVIMDNDDAVKLPSEYVLDAYIEIYFTCDVVEKQSLGDIKNPKDVLYVKNVKYQGKTVHSYDV